MENRTPPPTLIRLLAVLALGLACGAAYLLNRDATPPVPPHDASATDPAAARSPTPTLVFQPQELGFPMKGRPVITHLEMTDLDQDGLLDLLVCDAESNQVGWIRQFPRGVFSEQALADVLGPAHATVCDMNGDGRLDVLVASMNVILPNNDRIGSVIILENLGANQFKKHVLAQNIARVTDVRGVDLNGDGRVDLVVGQFGYMQGEVRWMENKSDWRFESHTLLTKSGTIHTPVADFNRDGRPDFAELVSQEDEEIHLFTNLGAGQFRNTVLWKAADPSWNSSGLEVCDVNGDTFPDLIYANGDGFNSAFMGSANWHGLQWLENDGTGHFIHHRIGDMTGCYSPCGVDLNGDGHMDIVTVSGFNEPNKPDAVWLMAWMNDGRQQFTAVPLAHKPTHLITVAAGDLDGNGIPVLVTGGFHLFPPFPAMSRVTLWRRNVE